MKTTVAAAIVALAPIAALAQSPIADACLFDALGQVPKADGLEITSASVVTKPMAPGERVVRIHVAEIKVALAERSVTYRFTCREALDTVTVVRREIVREVAATN